jgi:hypothetical protein
MSAEYTQIINLLDKLSNQELEQLRKRCSALSGLSAKRKNVDLREMNEDWILSGILHELEIRGMKEMIPSNFYIRNKSSFNSYWEGSLSCRQLFEKHIDARNTAKRIALGRICAKVLARKVEEFAPIVLDSMLNNVRMIPEAFDKSFPGYLQAGFIRFMIDNLRIEE